MASVVKIYKMQWPQHTSDPKNPTILVYEVDKYGERIGDAMELPIGRAEHRLFKKGPGKLWNRIFVKASMVDKTLVIHGFTMQGQWY